MRSIFNRTSKIKRVKKRGKFSNNYLSYIHSESWKVKRSQFIEWCKGSSNYYCWRCRDKSMLYQVHHQTYERLGKENFSDLELLCISCHKKEHSHMKTSKYEARRLNRAWISKLKAENKRAEEIHEELNREFRERIRDD